MNAVDMIGSLLDEFVPCLGEVSQLLVIPPEDPGRFDQAVPGKFRDSLGVVPVGLPTRNCLDLARVGNDDLHMIL